MESTTIPLTINGQERLLLLRKATKEDRDQILMVRPDLEDGRDYLPAYIDHYLSRPDRFFGFVAELDKEIVCFSMYQLLCQGNAAMAMSARSKVSIQGMGIFTLLEDYRHQYMGKFHPGSTRHVLSTTTEVKWYLQNYQMIAIKKKQTTTLCTRSHILYRTSLSSLKSCLESPNLLSKYRSEMISFAPNSQVCIDVVRNPICRSFFPHDVCIVHFDPFFLSGDEDLHYIFSHGSVELSYQVKNMEGRAFAKETDKAINVAISRMFKCKTGLRISLDTYGCDTDAILSHLFHHLVRLLASPSLVEQCPENIYIGIYSIITAPLYEVADILERYGEWEYMYKDKKMLQQLIQLSRLVSAEEN